MPSDNRSKPATAFPPWASLFFFILLIAAARFHTIGEPSERDLSVYSVIGHEMLQGRWLYSDLWDHKPPAIDLTYALAEKIVGYGPQELLFLGLLGAVMTLVGIYRVAVVAGMGSKAGFWSALIWTLVCSDLVLQANQPNTEVFDNLAVVWALAFLISYPVGSKSIALSGMMLAIASLYKPQAILYVGLFTIVIFLLEPKGRRLAGAIKAFGLLFFPSLAAWASIYLLYRLTGQWKDFYGAVILYNEDYANGQIRNLIAGLKFYNLFYPPLWFLAPLLFFGILSFFQNVRKNVGPWLFFTAYAAGTYYFVASAGRFHPHYYQLWLPVAAIGGGWALGIFEKWLKPFGKGLHWIPILLCLGPILYHEIPYYRLDEDQWSRKKYGDTFTECRELGYQLAGLLKSDETFFEFGNDPGLYFYSKKPEPTGIIYIHPAMNGPIAQQLWARYQRDLATHTGELMVVDNIALPGQYKQFLNRFRFWRFYPRNGHYALLVAKGGKLEARLEKEGSLRDSSPLHQAGPSSDDSPGLN